LKLDLGDPNAKEIKQLENFKKEIESMPEDEFKKMNNLIELFERGEEQKNLSKVIDEITKLKKIMDKKTLKV
jgi:Zn-dependent M32 family carboxypeptidase